MPLQTLLKLPPNAHLILNSEQRIHYQMPNHQHLLVKNEICQSMSKKGHCLDNAAIESFSGGMKPFSPQKLML
ncbi:MAG: hypothetical protein ACLRLU_06150 [Haemophilus parainfluenzae]